MFASAMVGDILALVFGLLPDLQSPSGLFFLRSVEGASNSLTTVRLVG